MFDDEDEITTLSLDEQKLQAKVESLILELLTLSDTLELKITELGLEDEEDDAKYPLELLQMLDKMEIIQTQLDILNPNDDDLDKYEAYE